jgi:hypothetical protein
MLETAASQVPGTFRNEGFPIRRKESERRLYRISEHDRGDHYWG